MYFFNFKVSGVHLYTSHDPFLNTGALSGMYDSFMLLKHLTAAVRRPCVNKVLAYKLRIILMVYKKLYNNHSSMGVDTQVLHNLLVALLACLLVGHTLVAVSALVAVQARLQHNCPWLRFACFALVTTKPHCLVFRLPVEASGLGRCPWNLVILIFPQKPLSLLFCFHLFVCFIGSSHELTCTPEYKCSSQAQQD